MTLMRSIGAWGVAVGCLVGVRGGDQPQWGESGTRNMVSAELGLVEDFDPGTGRNVKWAVALGSETHASPVIGSGRVLIGTNNENPRDERYFGDRGVLMCFDERDGGFLWQLVVPKYSRDPFQDWPRAGICSPATIEGERVYILSNRGEAMCLDLRGLNDGNQGQVTDEGRLLAPRGEEPIAMGPMDGDVLWSFDVHGGVGSYPHDAAHSGILVHGEHLYLNTGNGVDNTHRKIRAPEAPSLIVLDKGTGQLVGKDDEGIGPRIFHSTWASPSVGRVEGRSLIFFGGGDGVVYAFEALEPSVREEGEEVPVLRKVWWFDCDPEGPKEEVHRYNSNRQVSPSNIKGSPVFHEGRVYVTAGGDLWWGKREAWLKCIDASGTGDVTRSGEVWSYPLVRHSMATPSVDGGLVYATDCGGQVHCVDAVTGEMVWRHDAEGEIWASTLVADGKVYVGTRRGLFWVLAAGREKRVLSRIDMESPISGTAVAANGVLYVATMERLYAVAEVGK